MKNLLSQTSVKKVSIIKMTLCTLVMFVLCVAIPSCSNPEDDPGIISLPKDQPASVSYAANETSGQVTVVAQSPVSAYVSRDASGSNLDVDWLTIDYPFQDDGKWMINFQMAYNATGKSRTAYIVILCESEKVIVTVTQTNEEDSQVSTNEGKIIAICRPYYINPSGVPEQEYETKYEVIYENGVGEVAFSQSRPALMTMEYRDDYGGGQDEYEISNQVLTFHWPENFGVNCSLKIDGKLERTSYPSMKQEIETEEHSVEFQNGLAVKGSYWGAGDERPIEWDADYSAENYIVSTRNGEENPNPQFWEKSMFTWVDGNLQRIVSNRDNATVTMKYADNRLRNRHLSFDLNWILPIDLETYDFAAGDVSRLLPCFGLMGRQSRNLLTEVSENKDGKIYTYRMEYTVNEAYRTEVKVSRFFNGELQAFSEWTIEYHNIR